MPPLKPYSSELDYSYAPGVFPSLQLMQAAPERALRLLLSEKAQGEGVEKLRAICREHGVREETADRALSRLSGKGNCYAAVVFEKRFAELETQAPHVVLHRPMDEGNLGTIQRAMLGFGVRNLAIVRPAADAFDPKVVRATMGAIFSMRVRYYDDFEEYRREFSTHALYPFMLDGSISLGKACASPQTPWTLIFGNEGSGLPPEFAQMGTPVRIPHSGDIDSLNLAVAASIGLYSFTGGNLK